MVDRMDKRNDRSDQAPQKDEAARTEQAARAHRKPEMAQHEMLDHRLPKKDVAEGLEDFDGDEA